MSKQLYFETPYSGLIKVRYLGVKWQEIGSYNLVSVEVLETKHGYTKGETMESLPWHIVHKAGMRGGRQYARQAPLY